MSETGNNKTAVLLITCPDRKGLVATVADVIYAHTANILHTDEHTDPDTNVFLMRIEWDLAEFGTEVGSFARYFGRIAEQFQMRWRIAISGRRPRIAIFVSRLDHCLAD